MVGYKFLVAEGVLVSLTLSSKLARTSVSTLKKEFECRSGVEAQSVTPFGELNDVEASLAALDFRNERLRIPDLLGQRRLRKAGFVAQLHEQIQEGSVMPMVS